MKWPALKTEARRCGRKASPGLAIGETSCVRAAQAAQAAKKEPQRWRRMRNAEQYPFTQDTR